MTEQKHSNLTTIIVAVIAAIATLGAAYFSQNRNTNDVAAVDPKPKGADIVSSPEASNTTYNVTNIAGQVWMKTSFAGLNYQNGDPIPQASNIDQLREYSNSDTGCWCYYKFDAAYGKKYGKLYNWHAVNDPRGLAPKGWHIPTSEEWDYLIEKNGGIENAGKVLKNSIGWYANGNGNNLTQWSGLPSGVVFPAGNTSDDNKLGAWWSKTPENENPEAAIFVQLDPSNAAHSYYFSMDNMCAVRFIKD